ncbi:MAG: sigma-54-dependent Fis family transcriptional regulator [Planctomycetes bacterium]|nr:sigma-54-dependent Fis family transcriptional regulator [Planctomycetota bacterium]
MARILIVDDENDFRSAVAEVLRGAGHEISECETGNHALEILGNETFNVLLTDLRLPGCSGTEVLRTAARRMPDSILLVMTAYGSLDSAIDALRIGAHDYFIKPVNLGVLLHKVNQLVTHQAALAENRFLRNTLEIDVPSSGLVGRSEAIAGIDRLIAKVAAAPDSTVLITGETGTGKELVARAIHNASPRHERPFVAINCGAIPENLLESALFGHVRGAFTGADREKQGLFEVAADGTIFLDEIGEMPLVLQPKILRTLEDREIMRVGSTTSIRISARVIAATHRNLAKLAVEGAFRQDLYYRLNVVEIEIPPLRNRPQDIQPITMHYLERLCRSMNRPMPLLEPEALRALENYPWPGNVRELRNVLERALILKEGPRIGVEDLPGILTSKDARNSDDLKVARAEFEVQHILRVIAKCDGDKRRAAAAMGIDLSSLYRKVERSNESDPGE